jgi:hypothetical protein
MPIGGQSNGFQTTLAAAISTAQARRATLTSTALAPAVPFRLRIDDELVLVVTVSPRGDVSLVRGIEGTTRATHRSGVLVRQVLTAEDLHQAVRADRDGQPEWRARPAGVRAYQFATAR